MKMMVNQADDYRGLNFSNVASVHLNTFIRKKNSLVLKIS